MNFLFPGFLFALSAVAIPIIIHLFNFRKYKKVYFSNVQFLKEIEQKTSSSRKLKNLLILAARILAVVFLVLAFAKPYIPAENQSNSVSPQAISIYIDNSYSMETINKEGTLLDEAKRRAKEIVSAYGLNDKFQLLTNDFEGKHQRLISSNEFLDALEEVKISSSSKKIKEIIKRQQVILKEQVNSKKSAYLVSDFQTNMLGNDSVPTDSTISMRLVRVKATTQPNVSVDSVWFVSPIHRPGQSEKLVIQLKNHSDEKAKNIAFKLLVNNQQKAFGSLEIDARKTNRDTVSISGLNFGWQQAQLQLSDHPVSFDNNFNFSFYVQEKMPVLAINEQSQNPFLNAVYRADPFFDLNNASSGNINYSSLSSYPLIILNSINNISDGLSQQLTAYVKSGGTLLIFPSLDLSSIGLKQLLQNLGTDIPEEIVNEEAKVVDINLNHPIFTDVFEQVPKNINLPIAKKYIRYSNQSQTNKQVLLSLPGRRSFLSQYKTGKGKVFLSAVPLDNEASNLAQHAVFLPVMYRAALLSLRNNKLYYTIGKDEFLNLNKVTLSASQTLKLKKSGFETIPEVIQGESNTRLFIADQLREQGNYSLFKGDSLLNVFAFNENKTESDLSYADDDELKKNMPESNMQILSPDKESIQNRIEAVNAGFQLWKLCLILSLLFLAAEIVLVKYFKTKESKAQVV